MSTNNNRLGKEVRPIWRSSECETKKLTKISGSRLAALMQNSPGDVTALALSNRSIDKMEDLDGFADNLSRLDLSENQIGRLAGMINLKKLSMLNLSSNNFSGDAGLEDLRYLEELRTLNIGKNPNIKSIRSHLLKPLVNLQAFICNDCGLDKLSFIRFLPKLNTLVASYNNLKAFPIKEMGLFRFLSKISLGHNSLTEIPDLSSVIDLNELRLNHNKIEKISDAFINSRNAQSIKCLDLSHNLIADWDDAKKLTTMRNLTNLSLNNNQLPSKPWDPSLTIREDISADTLPLSEEEILYRRHMLLSFQRKVGVAEKDFIQLIVLDNRRVKMKWSQGGVSASTSTSVITNKIMNKDKIEEGRAGDKKQLSSSNSSNNSNSSNSNSNSINSINSINSSKSSKNDVPNSSSLSISSRDANSKTLKPSKDVNIDSKTSLGKRNLENIDKSRLNDKSSIDHEDDEEGEEDDGAQKAKKAKKDKKKEKKAKKDRDSTSDSKVGSSRNNEDEEDEWKDFSFPALSSSVTTVAQSAVAAAPIIPDKLQSALQKSRVGLGAAGGGSAWD